MVFSGARQGRVSEGAHYGAIFLCYPVALLRGGSLAEFNVVELLKVFDCFYQITGRVVFRVADYGYSAAI